MLSRIFKEAHKMTREMLSKYEVDYQVQFGLNLSYLLNQKEEKEMKELKFNKKGMEFCFRNPTWNKFYKKMDMEWKVTGIKENDKNDGYYYCSDFLPDKNVMTLDGVKINGKEILGVTPPDDLLAEIKKIYEQYKEKDFQERVNQNIKYTLNDTTTYGVYNGISEFDIEAIVANIKRKCNSKILLFPNEIATLLNKDKELRRIAEETYRPIDEEDNWKKEYLEWFREAAERKEAPGYGVIPNKIIRKKITDIILKEANKENKKRQEEEDRISHLFETAKETGEKQLVGEWLENCNDEDTECSLDVCRKWVMPDGTTKYTRNHTF